MGKTFWKHFRGVFLHTNISNAKSKIVLYWWDYSHSDFFFLHYSLSANFYKFQFSNSHPIIVGAQQFEILGVCHKTNQVQSYNRYHGSADFLLQYQPILCHLFQSMHSARSYPLISQLRFHFFTICSRWTIDQ